MNTDNIRDPLATEVIRLREGIEARLPLPHHRPARRGREMTEGHFCEDCGCGFEHGCVCGNCD